MVKHNGKQHEIVAAQATFAVLRMVAFVFSMWIGIGSTVFVLKIARGQPAELSDIFTGGPFFLPILEHSILFGLMVGLGTILCIVPGVFLGLMFGQFNYLIIDGLHGCGLIRLHFPSKSPKATS